MAYITTEFNGWNKSKLHMNSLLGNQSLPPSITRCVRYWLTLKAWQHSSQQQWVCEWTWSSPSLLIAYFLSCLHVFLFLSFLVSAWAIMGLGLWIPARPTVEHCMLVFGLGTCSGSLRLCSRGKHTYCVATAMLQKLHTQENTGALELTNS